MPCRRRRSGIGGWAECPPVPVILWTGPDQAFIVRPMPRTLLILLPLLLLLSACREPQPVGPRRLSPAAENRIAGQNFLAENARKPGVVVGESGLQHKVLVAGDGPVPTPGDVVRVHYVGRFVDGAIFESSRDRGDAPALLPLRQVMRGWQEGLTRMPSGSTWELYIPSNLAYGLDRAPEKIGPNRTLVFTIELFGIQR